MVVVRPLIASALVGALAVAVLGSGKPRAATLLWPGARHSREERDGAVLRGLEFMYGFARRPDCFRVYGADLIGAFWNIYQTSRDAELRRLAWNMGHERAIAWRRLHPAVRMDIGADELIVLVFGNDPAERLGVPDPGFRAQLEQAAARFSAADFLGWNPAAEPPPADLPKPCPKCGRQNARGATVCSRCGRKLEMCDRYDVYQDALIETYSGELAGMRLGARYADVLKWLPAMRPWPVRRSEDDDHYYAAVYAITHLVYTYNGYSQARVSPDCFPQEFAYLKDNLREAIVEKDPETMGEFLDSLRAFGLGFADRPIREGFDYLLSTQNPDGSWGDARDPDPYNRYHPTWTAVDGLRDYRWTRVLPCPAL